MNDAENVSGVDQSALSDGHAKHGFPVLVINGNEAERHRIINHLSEMWPFESDLVVECAADTREALEKIKATRFALLLLDWGTPSMSGREVLRTIRQNDVRTPVVVVSELPCKDFTEDLDSFSAARLDKNEMTPDALLEAIKSSLRLLERARPLGHESS